MAKRYSLYARLARLPWLKRYYAAKVFVVAFLGMSLPLLLLLAYVLSLAALNPDERLKLIALIAVVATIPALVTLALLHRLLGLLPLISQELHGYLNQGRLPALPSQYQDEIGRLMADTQRLITHLDQSRRSLEALAQTDSLSGVYNRRGGEQALQTDLARAARAQETLFLAVLDIDGLKAINDRYGHAFGDSCIRHVAQLIKSTIRGGDWLARWGGDEFVMLLWRTEPSAAQEVYIRIISILSAQPMLTDAGEYFELSLSIGACAYHRGMTLRELFQQADEQLYKAKAHGGGLRFTDPPGHERYNAQSA